MTGILAGEDTVGLIAASLGAGLALGLFYDIFRIRRYAYREMTEGLPPDRRHTLPETITVFGEDILFSCTAAVMFCVIFYRFSWGAVRWYALGAALASYAAYRMTVGRLIMSIASGIIRFIRRVVSWISGLLLRMVGLILRTAVYPLGRRLRTIFEAVMLPVYLRRSERLKAQILNTAEYGKTEQIQRSRWRKPKRQRKCFLSSRWC